MLGEVKNRVEVMIDKEQQETKKPMSRERKGEIMAQEMANTVVVHRSFLPNQAVPIIQLTADQVQSVVVPDDFRQRLVEKLKARYAATGSAEYAPTEANVRLWYLRSKSPTLADQVAPAR